MVLGNLLEEDGRDDGVRDQATRCGGSVGQEFLSEKDADLVSRETRPATLLVLQSDGQAISVWIIGDDQVAPTSWA